MIDRLLFLAATKQHAKDCQVFFGLPVSAQGDTRMASPKPQSHANTAGHARLEGPVLITH